MVVVVVVVVVAVVVIAVVEIAVVVVAVDVVVVVDFDSRFVRQSLICEPKWLTHAVPDPCFVGL